MGPGGGAGLAAQSRSHPAAGGAGPPAPGEAERGSREGGGGRRGAPGGGTGPRGRLKSSPVGAKLSLRAPRVTAAGSGGADSSRSAPHARGSFVAGCGNPSFFLLRVPASVISVLVPFSSPVQPCQRFRVRFQFVTRCRSRQPSGQEPRRLPACPLPSMTSCSARQAAAHRPEALGYFISFKLLRLQTCHWMTST